MLPCINKSVLFVLGRVVQRVLIDVFQTRVAQHFAHQRGAAGFGLHRLEHLCDAFERLQPDFAELLLTKKDDGFHAVVRAAPDKAEDHRILRVIGFQETATASKEDWKAYMTSRLTARVKGPPASPNFGADKTTTPRSAASPE